MKKSRKGITLIIAGVFLVMIMALTPISSYAASAITLSLDDESLVADVAPVIKDGRTLVPIRVITENLDCDVTWDKETKAVTITEKDGGVLKLIVGSTTGVRISTDGAESTFNMDVPASIIGGRTMVPVRAISENLSSNPQIAWSNALRKVCIYTPNYLTGKGIDDVNAYVASFKAPPKEAAGVTDLGWCSIELDKYDTFQSHIIKANDIYYVNVYDYLTQYLYDDEENVKYNKGSDYIEIIVPSDYTAKSSFSSYSSYLLVSKYLSKTQNEVDTIRYAVGNYSSTFTMETTTKLLSAIGPDEVIIGEDLGEWHSYPEEEYTQKDVFNEYFNNFDKADSNKWARNDGYTYIKTETNDLETIPFDHPIVMYNNEVYAPMEGKLLGAFNYNFNGNVLHGTDTTATPAPAPTPVPAPAPVQSTQPIYVGDTVYATAVFFKCWGTVDEIKGSKAKVYWVQVTGLYDMLVSDYSEIDFMSQASMTQKGIMIGASTWVNISDLHKK